VIADRPVAVVTGASGYLGSRISDTLEAAGWRVVKLARSPAQVTGECHAYDLTVPVTEQVRSVLRSADVFVHAAYDMSVTSEADIWRVNVEGTRRVLAAATDSATRRVLVLSSMSAFDGTTQMYGRAKLDIEAMTMRCGGIAIRPGVVIAESPRGMAGALHALTRLPFVPLLTGEPAVHVVREDELLQAVTALATVPDPGPITIPVAHSKPIPLRDLMTLLANGSGRDCRFVPVPWWAVYYALRSAEAAHLRLPFRADSLLALVRTPPDAADSEALRRLGVPISGYAPALAEQS
jgi:nucleoside-diphosphate-sugar epimerase